ncbi:MAG: leucine-rich repeat domain-containing protein [Kiritimatiellae bacterium]|nr:leucine-rich repeat domain-containing protein [Kiritimatiellia bacterium]
MNTFRILRICICSVILVMALGSNADTTHTETVNGITWTYTVSNGKASIGGGSQSFPAMPRSVVGAIEIPSVLGGYPVTKIARYAFYSCREMVSLTIPASVTSIEDYAFRGCSSLTHVAFGSGVVEIGSSVFYGSGIESFAVDEQNSAYKSVSGLLLTKDGKTLIYGINGDVTIPAGVKSISDSAFASCRRLTSVLIPNSVISIGSCAFERCDTLTLVKMPDAVTNIGYRAFYACTGLSSITIPDGVISIGDNAFSFCSGLTSVMIGRGLTSIGSEVFDGCNSMEQFIVDERNSAYKSVSGLLLTKDGKKLISGVSRDVTIPDGVMSIDSWAFYLCTNLTSVTIPASVTSIGDYAFRQCYGLTNITFSIGVTSIGLDAFYYCRNLTSVVIPDSVTSKL